MATYSITVRVDGHDGGQIRVQDGRTGATYYVNGGSSSVFSFEENTQVAFSVSSYPPYRNFEGYEVFTTGEKSVTTNFYHTVKTNARIDATFSQGIVYQSSKTSFNDYNAVGQSNIYLRPSFSMSDEGVLNFPSSNGGTLYLYDETSAGTYKLIRNLSTNTDHIIKKSDFSGSPMIQARFNTVVMNTVRYSWTHNSYTVQYYYENSSGALVQFGGSGYVSKSNPSYTIPSSEPTRSGYIFAGWSTTYGSTTPNSNYKPGNTIPVTSNLVLYAVWSNYVTISLQDSSQVLYLKLGVGWYSDTALTKPISKITIPTKEGYDFYGYRDPSSNLVIDGQGNIRDGFLNSFTSNTTLRIVWTPKTYDIAYVPTVDSIDQTIYTEWKKHDVNITLYGVTYYNKDSNYTQTKWIDLYGTGGTYPLNGTYSENKRITLYPYWEGISVTITLNANGGNLPAGVSNRILRRYDTYYTTPSLALPTPTRANHTFLGWYKADGTKIVSNSTKITDGSDHTIYAQWADSTRYSVSVVASPTNGGTVSGGGNYSSQDNVTISAEAAPEYTFSHWLSPKMIRVTDNPYTFLAKDNEGTWQAAFSLNSLSLGDNGPFILPKAKYEGSPVITNTSGTVVSKFIPYESGYYCFTISMEDENQIDQVFTSIYKDEVEITQSFGKYVYSAYLQAFNTYYIYNKWQNSTYSKTPINIHVKRVYKLTTEWKFNGENLELPEYKAMISFNGDYSNGEKYFDSLNIPVTIFFNIELKPENYDYRFKDIIATNGTEITQIVSNQYEFTLTEDTTLILDYRTQTLVSMLMPDTGVKSYSGFKLYWYGEQVTLNMETEPGYEFFKWACLDDAEYSSEEQEFSFTVPADKRSLSYFLMCDPISYSITYDLNGGSITENNLTEYNIETITFTLINPTKQHYIFDGWLGTDLSEPQKEVTIETGNYGNRSYLATWKPVEYSIVYSLDGGTLPEDQANPSRYTIESDNITLNNPSRLGYVFNGWSGTDIDPLTMTVTIERGSSGARFYVANWKPKVCPVQLPGTGVSPQTLYVVYNDGWYKNPTISSANKITTLEALPIKEGYTFLGYWFNGNQIIDSDGNIIGSSTIAGDSTTLFALDNPSFEINQYLVTLSMNTSEDLGNKCYIYNKDGVELTEGYYDYNTEFTLKAIPNEENGQSFSGWAINNVIFSTDLQTTFTLGSQNTNIQAIFGLGSMSITVNCPTNNTGMTAWIRGVNSAFWSSIPFNTLINHKQSEDVYLIILNGKNYELDTIEGALNTNLTLDSNTGYYKFKVNGDEIINITCKEIPMITNIYDSNGKEKKNAYIIDPWFDPTYKEETIDSIWIGNKQIFGKKPSKENIFKIDTLLGDTLYIGTVKPFGIIESYDTTYAGMDITKVIIPNGVTQIPDSAFNSCRELTSIIIPDSVITLGTSSFYSCRSLKKVYCSNNISILSNGAFYDCQKLKKIKFPSNLKQIDSNACRDLFNITKINLGDTKIETIGTYVFSYCQNLQKIILPSTLTKINSYAFRYCYKLQDVYYNGTINQWNEVTIMTSGNDYLLNATIHCKDGIINPKEDN